MSTIPIFNASIGIIGGADGPTAIFVSGNPVALVIAAVVLILMIALVVLLVRKNRKR